MSCTAPPRRIRSYVRRERPLTAGAKASHEELWPRFGVEPHLWSDLKKGARGLVLDIGFGDGEALLTMAEADPERDYVGVEMYRTGIVKALRGIADRGLSNVRLIQADAKSVVTSVGDGHLDAVLVFFPDPWPKTRHHKRRLVRAEFLGEIARVLRMGGLFHMATDWQPYADEVAVAVDAHPAFLRKEGSGGRPVTKFERRGQRLGHSSHDLRFTKIG